MSAFAANYSEGSKGFLVSTKAFLPGSVIVENTPAIFKKEIKLSHSCAPNTMVTKSDEKWTCRSIQSVKDGEKLTTSFNETYNDHPTFERRAYYLLHNGFFCTCPRCTAPGDDTRQFNCHNANCSGRHYATQPTIADIPHLLICSECKQPAPAAYETAMFELEATLPQKAEELQAEMTAIIAQRRVNGEVTNFEIVQRVLDMKVPVFHRKSTDLSLAVCMFQMPGMMDPVNYSVEKFVSAAKTFTQPFLNMMEFPNEITQGALFSVSTEILMKDGSESVSTLVKGYLQQALRMELIMKGGRKEGEARDTQIDEKLTLIHVALPPQAALVSECMFCGERPESAEINLSRCGKCVAVTYCSSGCQKAHWKAHKKCCGK